MLTYEQYKENNLDTIVMFNTLINAATQFTGEARQSIESYLVNTFLNNVEFLSTLQDQIIAQTKPTNVYTPYESATPNLEIVK